MPRRPTKTASGIIAYVVLAIGVAVIALLNFIKENPWILLVLLAVAAIVIGASVLNARTARLHQEEERQRRQIEDKKREEERVQGIMSHKDEWGDDMCQWLIEGRYTLADARVKGILDNWQPLGQEKCQRLLHKTIAIGDTDNMVRLALGEPTSIDEQTITERDSKFRWIYGVPRRGATYVWFRHGQVTKIKQ
jgi:hypothetical protein